MIEVDPNVEEEITPLIKCGQKLVSVGQAVASGAAASTEELQFLVEKSEEISKELKRLVAEGHTK